MYLCQRVSFVLILLASVDSNPSVAANHPPANCCEDQRTCGGSPGACCSNSEVVVTSSRDHFVPVEKHLSPQWIERLTARGDRTVYRGKELTTVGMPCGGVCAGQLYVRGDGTLAQWWIANNAGNTGLWIWGIPKDGRKIDYTVRTLQGEFPASYRTYRPVSYVDQGFALRVKSDGSEPQMATLDHQGFDDIRFIGEYPIATIDYRRSAKPPLPVAIRAEVFSPFIPLNARDSAIPVTVLRYSLANTSDRPLDVSIAGWLQNAVCMELAGRSNSVSQNVVVRHAGLTSIQMEVLPTPTPSAEAPRADRPPDTSSLRDTPQFGDMTLTAIDSSATTTARRPSREEMLAELERTGELRGPAVGKSPLGEKCTGALCIRYHLAPRQSRRADFLITWYFPNRHQGNRAVPGAGVLGSGPWVGNRYTHWFKSSLDAARYVAENFARLDGQTHRFRDVYFDTTLPYWFAHRVAMPISTLATETCQWWANGRFYGFEGVGCCEGTCNHVWHYEQALGQLFPELQRSMLEMQTYNPRVGFIAESGLIRYRGEFDKDWAADGQAGNILMALRQHQCSPNDEFLRTNWPAIRKSLEFLIEQDGNADGLIQDRQWNTYDIEFFGANTMVGSMYLAALRAGEEMARVVGDEAFAETCRRIFRSGSKLSVQRLFNGEYFVQEVDLQKHPDWQYGNGCLADQMIGQTWAHLLGLGYLYPEKYVRSALHSVWKYNWAPDVGPQIRAHRPELHYADPGEAGLLLCTWPKGPHMGPKSVRYRDTVWAGIEYQVAAGMILEGMTTEGLSIVRGIHERYDPAKHNPWNSILCGDHYSRDMASWGCLLSAGGYTCDCPAGKIGFAPRISAEDFQSFFTAAEGWGSLQQIRRPGRQSNRIELRWGRLRLKTLQLKIPPGSTLRETAVTVAGRSVEYEAISQGHCVTIALKQSLLLQPERPLDVESRF